jgi:hypothetical protein
MAYAVVNALVPVAEALAISEQHTNLNDNLQKLTSLIHRMHCLYYTTAPAITKQLTCCCQLRPVKANLLVWWTSLMHVLLLVYL